MLCRGNPVTLLPNLDCARSPNATDTGTPGARFGVVVQAVMVSSGVSFLSLNPASVSLLSMTSKPHPWGCSLRITLGLAAPCHQHSFSQLPRRWEVPAFSGYFDSIATHLLGWTLSSTQPQCKI